MAARMVAPLPSTPVPTAATMDLEPATTATTTAVVRTPDSGRPKKVPRLASHRSPPHSPRHTARSFFPLPFTIFMMPPYPRLAPSVSRQVHRTLASQAQTHSFVSLLTCSPQTADEVATSRLPVVFPIDRPHGPILSITPANTSGARPATRFPAMSSMASAKLTGI